MIPTIIPGARFLTFKYGQWLTKKSSTYPSMVTPSTSPPWHLQYPHMFPNHHLSLIHCRYGNVLPYHPLPIRPAITHGAIIVRITAAALFSEIIDVQGKGICFQISRPESVSKLQIMFFDFEAYIVQIFY